MPELARLQAAFGAALEVPGGDPASGLFRGDAASVARRFDIYRGNARANAAKALAAAYPVVGKIVGAEFFGGLAREYEATHPSVEGDLNEYGGFFGEFLDGFAHVRGLPYLADVARVEWAVHRAHYARDAGIFDPTRLAQVDPESQAGLAVVLHPACALLHSRWPLARLWEIHQDGYAGAFEIDLEAGPCHALVFRPRFRVEVEQVDPAHAAFLAAAQAGATLGGALAAAQSLDAAFALDRALARWVACAVIVDFRLNAEAT